MIRTWAIIGLCALALGLALRGQHLQARALQAEATLASATAELAQVRLADKVHRRYLTIAASIEAGYAALITEVQTMEGADAPLSDYLRAVDQRLQ